MLKLKILTEEPVKKVYTPEQIRKFEKVKATYEKHGCVLISTISDYKNQYSNLKYICVCDNGQASGPYRNFKDNPLCRNESLNCFSLKEREKQEKTIKEYRELFANYGCELLEDVYKKSHLKYLYKCSCGENDEKTIINFRRTPHCNNCTGTLKIPDMEKRYLENECKLLDKISSTYSSNEYKFICKCGKPDCKTYFNFNKSPRCGKCDELFYVKTIEQKYIDRGAVLLSTDKLLQGTQKCDDPTPLNFKCYCGNDKCEKPLAPFLQTPYCDECSKRVKERQYREKSVPFSEMKSFVELNGYTVVSTENDYINSKGGMDTLCPRKHPCHFVKKSFLRGCSCCHECGKENKITNLIEKYGVRNVMHIPEVVAKAMKNAFKKKVYVFPSGNEVLCQWYENYCIDELIGLGIKEEEISMQLTDGRSAPIIKYDFNGRDCRYYPDFYIPHLNLIIEVKSDFTFDVAIDKNFTKRIACIEQGYKFQFWIYNNKGIRIRTI